MPGAGAGPWVLCPGTSTQSGRGCVCQCVTVGQYHAGLAGEQDKQLAWELRRVPVCASVCVCVCMCVFEHQQMEQGSGTLGLVSPGDSNRRDSHYVYANISH